VAASGNAEKIYGSVWNRHELMQLGSSFLVLPKDNPENETVP